MRNAGSPRASALEGLKIAFAGQTAPFGPDLIFAADDLADFIFHIEICEDYWAPQPPSTIGALAGALILCNLSASNITIGKADERKLLCAAQASRCHAAYIYSAAGPGESTTDLAWDGQGSIYELGELLAETGRFDREAELAVADIDVQRLRLERMRNGTFNDNARAAGHPEKRFRRIAFEHRPSFADIGFERQAAPLPLRAQPARAARPGLLRGVQHPGAGPRPPLPGDQRQASRHRRLGRARFAPTP